MLSAVRQIVDDSLDGTQGTVCIDGRSKDLGRGSHVELSASDCQPVDVGSVRYRPRRLVQGSVFVGVLQEQHVALLPTGDVNVAVWSNGDDPNVLQVLGEGLDLESLRHLQRGNALVSSGDFVGFEGVDPGGNVRPIALLGKHGAS